jgi:hypothetical protein
MHNSSPEWTRAGDRPAQMAQTGLCYGPIDSGEELMNDLIWVAQGYDVLGHFRQGSEFDNHGNTPFGRID